MLAIPVILGCSRQTDSEPRSLTADQAWVQSVCIQASPDTAGWPRYRVGRISISVPPEYRLSVRRQFSLSFGRGTASLGIILDRSTGLPLSGSPNMPGQELCRANYGGFPNDAWAWNGVGEYRAMALWEGLNGPGDRPRVRAIIRTSRLQDAIRLREALHTIAVHSDPER